MRAATAGPLPVLDVVVTVFNGERDLKPCAHRLAAHLAGEMPFLLARVRGGAPLDTVRSRLARTPLEAR